VGPKEISEGIALITAALSKGSIGAYQLRPPSPPFNAEAARAEDTGWPRILALYDLLQTYVRQSHGDAHHAIAAAMVYGPPKGLDLLNALDADGRLPAIIAWTPFVPICWNVRRPSGRDCTLPYRRQPDDEPAGTELPHHPSRPAQREHNKPGIRLPRN